VTLGVFGSPATLDPYSPAASDLTYALAAPVYPSLFRFDPLGHPHPYLAKSIAEIPGGIRVTLRPARWSNGRPVSAADVVATVARARPPSGFSRIAKARAVGTRVVELRGKIQDWRSALATLANVLPLGKARRLSAGPFQIQAFVPGLQLAFRRNPMWWGRPLLDGVRVEFMPSLKVMLLLLGAGKIDAAAPPSSVNLDDRLDALGVHHSATLGWESVQLRFSARDLSRADRRTLAAAVDRERLRTGFIRGAGRISDTLSPAPGPDGVTGPWSGPIRGGPRVTGPVALAVPKGDELLELLQRVLQKEMTKVASDVEIEAIEAQSFYGRLGNRAGVSLRRISGAPGPASDARVHTTMTALPLFEVDTVLAWRGSLRGLHADPTFDGPLWNVERWSRRSTSSPSR
jgi:ABC-type transport system substrate-binding protein